VILRRRRFGDTILRQLDLFVRDHSDVLDDVAIRLARYNAADRDDAEELYGDYVDAVETGTEILTDLRDHYAAALPHETAERYVDEFNRAVGRRLPAFALEIESR
jgi:hypothetical protein